MTTSSTPVTRRAPSARRRRRQNGQEIIEFTLVFLPMFMMIFVMIDLSWAIFAKATLAWSVRDAVRYGITVTGSGTDLTTLIKQRAAKDSMGLLSDTSGPGGTDSRIKVYYYFPGPPLKDVSKEPSGNQGGNIIQVTVQDYNLNLLLPLFSSWTSPISKSVTLAAAAADIIEPLNGNTKTPIGIAP